MWSRSPSEEFSCSAEVFVRTDMFLLKILFRSKKCWISSLLIALCAYGWFGVHLVALKAAKGIRAEYGLHGATSREQSAAIGNDSALKLDERIVDESVNEHDDKRHVRKATVTMFTTIRDRECRKAIHERLMRNWAALSPHLDPVLFVPFTEYNTSTWIDIATSYNWAVRKLYALRHDLPIITAMFKEALRISTTPFVGYANADILFDESLITTLRYLRDRLDVDNEMVLVVGRRRNVNITTIPLGSGSNLTTISRLDVIRPFHGKAIDYFIVSRRGLPWQDIPDFVVGRNGYDNWLVAKSQNWRHVTLIDASGTVLALHQSGTDGLRSGSRTVAKGTERWNKELIKGFRYENGSIADAPFYMKGDCVDSSRVGHRVHCNQIYNLTLQRRTRKRHQRKKITTKIIDNTRKTKNVGG